MSSKPRPKRSARKDPWDEDVLMTSDKSKLINLDLVKILAKPEAWDCLEEDEKRQVLSLLPEHTHPNPEPSPDDPDSKIPPLPQDFLRYSNGWRGGVRQFQAELEWGRYNPTWLSQADEAMKERAGGKFDAWKEKEFEQFWGQKQKLEYESYAGEASRVKLETLVEHGVIRKGDVWVYSRVFFLGDKGNRDRALVEKEVKVVDIDGASLTFAVPAGSRVIYPHHIEISEEKLAEFRKPASSKGPKQANGKPQRATRSSKRRTSARQASPHKRQQLRRDSGNSESVMSDANGESPTKDTEGSHVDKDGPSTVQNETTTDGDGESAKGDGHAKEETESIKPAEQKETNHQEIEAKAGTTEQTETTQQEHVAEATGAAESQPQKVDLSAESVEQTEAQHAGKAAEAVEQAGGQTQKAESPTKETNDQEAVDQAGATEHTETETNQQKHEHIANATSEQPSSPQKDSKSTPEQEIKNESKAKEGNTTTRNFKPKSSPPATQDDLIIVPNITNPTPLEARILAIHGQFKGIRSVNSWKAIRCIRNNQDMGSLWEVRQGWYLKHHKHK